VPVSTYNYLMKEFGKAGCLEGVFVILDAMYAAGIQNYQTPPARLVAHPEHMTVAWAIAHRLFSSAPLPWPKQPIPMLGPHHEAWTSYFLFPSEHSPMLHDANPTYVS